MLDHELIICRGTNAKFGLEWANEQKPWSCLIWEIGNFKIVECEVHPPIRERKFDLGNPRTSGRFGLRAVVSQECLQLPIATRNSKSRQRCVDQCHLASGNKTKGVFSTNRMSGKAPVSVIIVLINIR